MSRDKEIQNIFEIADDSFQGLLGYYLYTNFAYFMTLLYIPVVFGAFNGNKLTSNKI